jgi:hypothetical protein
MADRLTTRFPVLVGTSIVALAVTALVINPSSASAAASVSTVACTTGGQYGGLSENMVIGPDTFTSSEQDGNSFVAPVTGTLTSFTADLGADGPQAAEVALYDADSSGPTSTTPVWSSPVTINATGASQTFAEQTFVIGQPVTAGQTYLIALIAGTATANTNWALTNESSASCNPGVQFEDTAGDAWTGGESAPNYIFDAEFKPASTKKPEAIKLMTCVKVTKHRHAHAAARAKCARQAVSAAVNLKGKVTARLTRGGKLYASGTFSRGRLHLSAKRALKPMTYTLTLRRGKGKHRVVVRDRLTYR